MYFCRNLILKFTIYKSEKNKFRQVAHQVEGKSETLLVTGISAIDLGSNVFP